MYIVVSMTVYKKESVLRLFLIHSTNIFVDNMPGEGDNQSTINGN